MKSNAAKASDDLRFEVEVKQDRDFRFTVDFGLEGVDVLHTDEPEPLGEGEGPNPARLLAAAVGNCLAASLHFCLRKKKVNPEGIRAEVTGTMTRTARGRLRIGQLDVVLRVDGPTGAESALEFCLDRFEDFCVVTESVRTGIDVMVEVRPRISESGEDPAERHEAASVA
ncbi:MAG: OsmC family protein [Gemmatimonadota bacterium]